MNRALQRSRRARFGLKKKYHQSKYPVKEFNINRFPIQSQEEIELRKSRIEAQIKDQRRLLNIKTASILFALIVLFYLCRMLLIA